jgi:hypothetical protein
MDRDLGATCCYYCKRIYFRAATDKTASVLHAIGAPCTSNVGGRDHDVRVPIQTQKTDASAYIARRNVVDTRHEHVHH